MKKIPLFYHKLIYFNCVILIIDSFLGFLLLRKSNNSILHSLADSLVLASIPVITGFGFKNYQHLKKIKELKNDLEIYLKQSLFRLFFPDNIKLPDIDGVDFHDLCTRLLAHLDKIPLNQFKNFFFTLELDYPIIINNQLFASQIDGLHNFLYSNLIATLESIKNEKQNTIKDIEKINAELKKSNKNQYSDEQILSNIVWRTKSLIKLYLENCIQFSEAYFEDFIFPAPKAEVTNLDYYHLYEN